MFGNLFGPTQENIAVGDHCVSVGLAIGVASILKEKVFPKFLSYPL